MRPGRLVAAVGVIALCAASAAADDTIPNPEFENWSKFKRGTSVTLKSMSEAMGSTTEVLITVTLAEAGAEKVVLETTSVAKVNGMEFKTPAARRDVTKTITLGKGVKREEFAAGKPPGTLEEGTETLKVGGAEVKTRWYRFTADVDKVKTEGKSWMSDDVPGRFVRSEASTTGTFAGKSRMELIEIKKP